jgi:hypothetical protein
VRQTQLQPTATAANELQLLQQQQQHACLLLALQHYQIIKSTFGNTQQQCTY